MDYKINFEDSNGYLRTTIDNETIEIPLKKIKKIPSQIINRNIENIIPIYENIPIDLEFYQKPINPENSDKAEDDINFDLYSNLDIIAYYKDEQHKVDGEWKFQDIFTSYDNYKDLENLTPIDKGIVNIKIFDKNNNTIYNRDINFENHQLITELTNELTFGVYTIVITYLGSKYFLPSTLSYNIFIEKRQLDFKFHKDAYNGNPLEVVNIKAQLRDKITKRPISNVNIYYTFNSIEYLTISDNNGYININIQLPEQKYSCTTDTIIYDLEFYINNETYYSDTIKQNIVENKLETEISAQTVPIEDSETQFYLKGSVIAKNYDIIETTKHGEITLDFDDGQHYETFLSPDGLFDFLLDATDFQNIIDDTIETKPINIIKEVQTKTILEIESSYPNGKEFAIKANVNAIENNEIVRDGIIYFTMHTTSTPTQIITQYVAEVDNNGEAYGYFYPSAKGDYKITAEYRGIFEYQNSIVSQNIKIV